MKFLSSCLSSFFRSKSTRITRWYRGPIKISSFGRFRISIPKSVLVQNFWRSLATRDLLFKAIFGHSAFCEICSCGSSTLWVFYWMAHILWTTKASIQCIATYGNGSEYLDLKAIKRCRFVAIETFRDCNERRWQRLSCKATMSSYYAWVSLSVTLVTVIQWLSRRCTDCTSFSNHKSPWWKIKVGQFRSKMF